MGILTKLRSLFDSSGGAQAKSDEKVDPRRAFSEEVQAILASAPEVTEVVALTEDFGLTLQVNGRAHQLYLGNLFEELREASPAEREERVLGFVAGLSLANEDAVTWEEAQGRLVPLLRSSTFYLEAMDRMGENLQVKRPFAPFLIEVLGVDWDTVTKYVAETSIAEWGVERDEVFAAARRAATTCFGDDVAPYDPDANYPLWHVSRADSYESSRLLLPGWLVSFRGKVLGRPVAIVPERSTLIVGGDGDDACLRRLISLAEREYAASPRSISPALYTVDDRGVVVPLVLPEGHPLAHDVALGHLRMALAEYESQRAVLQESLGEDIYVAGFTGIRRDDGSPYSFTTWAADVSSMLPEADVIAFVIAPPDESEPDIFRVSWSDVMRITGELLELSPSCDPPRWQTKGWPDERKLNELRAVAL